MKLQVQHGDIVVFHSHGWLSICIQFFMNVSRWFGFKFKPLYAEVPNHIAMGDNDNSVIEARAEGVFITPMYADSISKGKKIIRIYRYPWSIKQETQINLLYNCFEGTPYQYANFFQYILYIVTFGIVWVGGKGTSSSNKIYCSELAARILYMITVRELAKSDADHNAHIYFRDYWKINPLQIERWCKTNCELVQEYNLE